MVSPVALVLCKYHGFIGEEREVFFWNLRVFVSMSGKDEVVSFFWQAEILFSSGEIQRDEERLRFCTPQIGHYTARREASLR
jgi:hypothetical protein